VDKQCQGEGKLLLQYVITNREDGKGKPPRLYPEPALQQKTEERERLEDRGHITVSQYPGACRQNQTEIFQITAKRLQQFQLCRQPVPRSRGGSNTESSAVTHSSAKMEHRVRLEVRSHRSSHLVSSDLVSTEPSALRSDPVRRGCDQSDMTAF